MNEIPPLNEFPADMLQSAANLLLIFVSAAPTGVAYYSQFYDGTLKRHRELMEWIHYDDDSFSAELAIDLAAMQLSVAGLIAIIELDRLLENGMHDFSMQTTLEGERFIARGRRFICHSHFYFGSIDPCSGIPWREP